MMAVVIGRCGIKLLLFIGFCTEFLGFCCTAALNHKDLLTMQEIMYDCSQSDDCNLNTNMDCVLNEVILRLFVGMALFNNLVLLGSVLVGESHTHMSLSHMSTMFNPLAYALIVLLLLFDLQISETRGCG